MADDIKSALSALDARVQEISASQIKIPDAPLVSGKLVTGTQQPVSIAKQPWNEGLVTELVIYVLVFIFLTLCIVTTALWKIGGSGALIFKIFVVLTIIGMADLLLIVSYDQNQLTPIVGLFGAIIGYVLGKDSKSDEVKGV